MSSKLNAKNNFFELEPALSNKNSSILHFGVSKVWNLFGQPCGVVLQPKEREPKESGAFRVRK